MTSVYSIDSSCQENQIPNICCAFGLKFAKIANSVVGSLKMLLFKGNLLS